MSSDTVAYGLAVVGVLGTISAGAITQLVSARSRRRELETMDHQRQMEETRQEVKSTLLAKRSCYISLNQASRQFVTALNDYLHRIESGSVAADDLAGLDEAKRVHRDSYSESQMIASDAVVAAASDANKALSRAYGAIRRLGRESSEQPLPGRAPIVDIQGLWASVGAMRKVMRQDLGL